MSDITHAIVAIALAIVGLATVATLVSRNANTSGVISSASQGFSGALAAAEAPVSGNSFGMSFGGLTGIGAPVG